MMKVVKIDQIISTSRNHMYTSIITTLLSEIELMVHVVSVPQIWKEGSYLKRERIFIRAIHLIAGQTLVDHSLDRVIYSWKPDFVTNQLHQGFFRSL